MQTRASRSEFIRNAGMAVTGLIATVHPLSGAAAAPQAQPTLRTSMGSRLRALVEGPDTFECLGVHDILTARLVEIHGFPSVFIGGSTVASNGHALRDNGLVSTSELIEFAAGITANIDIPALADADDAGGTPLDVYRSARAFERASVGGVSYEDRIRSERLKGNTQICSTADMVDRIHAAKDAAPDLVTVVRTESLGAGFSMEETLERGIAYAEAGADMLFFAGMRIDDFPRAADTVNIPLYGSFNVPLARAREVGVKLHAYTSTLRGIAMGAVHNALLEFEATGLMTNTERNSLPGSIQARLTRNEELSERSRRYNMTR